MNKLIKKYLKHLEVRGRSPNTIKGYKIILGQFLEYCTSRGGPEVDPQSVNRDIIRGWIRHLSENTTISKNTIRKKGSTVRSFFNYLQSRGHINKNPAKGLHLPKGKQRIPETITPDGITRLMKQANGDDPQSIQDRAILELFYSTGMRLSELIGLNLSDINLDKKEVTVHGKGNKDRILPLRGEALKTLRRHLTRREKVFIISSRPQQPLFLSSDKDRIKPRAVQRMVKKYMDKAGCNVTQKSPHILRHSFATHMLNAGVNIRIIQEFLGHSTIAATQIYLHTSKQWLKNEYESAFNNHRHHAPLQP